MGGPAHRRPARRRAAAPGATIAEPDGRTKVSAAWLIEHAGYQRGFTAGEGRVSLSTKHALAITNRGGATTSELLDLAREVRDGVQSRFGVSLEPEPTLVGCAL